jgi:hypothetical protein
MLNSRYTVHGGNCGCCFIGDAAVVRVDPTGTGSIRRQFNAESGLKWRQLRNLSKQIIIEQDLLSLSAKGLMQIANPAVYGGATKIQMFQRWFDYALNAALVQGDGSWMRRYIAQAYADGEAFARKQLRRPINTMQGQHRLDAITQLAVVELQGVAEAVSQKAVRAVANGLLHNAKPAQIFNIVSQAIVKVGMNRVQTMIELIVVKAFNEAVLDCYEAAQVLKVGLLPEARIVAKVDDARRGPGSRSSRASTPSRSTIGRIRRAEREVEALGKVNVRTAGDELVCPVCEGISEDGPYQIDTARSLIPAHPRCRCTFVPVDDARFSSDL